MATGHSEKREAVSKLKETATESTNQISRCVTEFKAAHRNRDNDQERLESIETEVYENVIKVLEEQRSVIDDAIKELQAKCIIHMKRETAGRNKDSTKPKTTGDSGIYSADSAIIREESAYVERNGDGNEDCTDLKGVVTNPTTDETGSVTLCLRDGTPSTGRRNQQENRQGLDLDGLDINSLLEKN